MFTADIGDKRRFALPGDAIAFVEWAATITPTAPAAFEKMQAGRVRLLPGAAYTDAVASAGADAEALAAVHALMAPAKWERSQRITVPAEMAWHLFGAKIIRGAVYVHPTADWFELWGERYYAQWVLGMRDTAADHLPD